MPRRRDALLLLAVLPLMAASVSLGGCTRGPANMYVMSPVGETAVGENGEGGASAAEPVVAVVRVQLPDYLNRPEIVSRRGPNGLEAAENDRWGEPLQTALPRIMAQDLSHFISGARVVPPGEGRGQRPPYEYLVSLDSYEPNGKGQAVMRGHWRLREIRSGKVLAEGDIDQAHPIPAGNYPAVVQALNQDLEDASRQIAAATESRVQPAESRAPR